MIKIGLVGPYSPRMKQTVYRDLPKAYEIEEIPSIDKYTHLALMDYVILRTLKFDSAVIESCKRLKMIQKYAVGFDTIDIAFAAARNIPVVICTGINTEAVAEHTILHMLAVLRNLLPLNKRLCEGTWAKDEFVARSFNLQGKLVGLLGFGNIGKRVATLAKGFGADVQYFDPYRAQEKDEKALGVSYVSFDQLISTSEILSLHLPSNPNTLEIINSGVFNKMPSSAILINTARGNLVNENDLIEALKNGKLAGAGLDVFYCEPLKKDSPLLSMENVVLTPHVGGSTAGNDIKMMQQCLSNIIKFENGEPIEKQNIVNLKLLKEPLPIRFS